MFKTRFGVLLMLCAIAGCAREVSPRVSRVLTCPQAIAQLRSRSEAERDEAALRLRTCAIPDPRPALLRALLREDPEGAYWTIISSLRRLPPAAQDQVRALRSPDAETRRRAALALPRIGDDRWDFLLKDSDPAVRFSYAGRLDYRALPRILRAVAEEPDYDVAASLLRSAIRNRPKTRAYISPPSSQLGGPPTGRRPFAPFIDDGEPEPSEDTVMRS